MHNPSLYKKIVWYWFYQVYAISFNGRNQECIEINPPTKIIKIFANHLRTIFLAENGKIYLTDLRTPNEPIFNEILDFKIPIQQVCGNESCYVILTMDGSVYVMGNITFNMHTNMNRPKKIFDHKNVKFLCCGSTSNFIVTGKSVFLT